MSPPLSEPSLDYQYPPSEPYPAFLDSTSPGPSVTDFSTSENLCLWQDGDGIYQWADAPPARSDPCLAYSLHSYYNYPSPFSSETVPHSADYYLGYRLGDLEHYDNPYISHLAQQVRNGPGRPLVQDHRSSIARACDNFLSQGSSIFSDGHSSSKRGPPTDYRPSIPQHDPRPPSRKRSRESLDDTTCHLKEEDDNAHPSSLPAANDACRLPQQPMLASSQAPSSSPVRIPRRTDIDTLNAKSHAREHGSRVRLEEHRCIGNKRVHRSSEGPIRQESAMGSMPTWPIPDDQVMKGAKKPGEQKKQALACLFCRERKIACGRPPPHSPDQTCNQCARRGIHCQYPTESRRGQHKRRRKPIETEPVTQSTPRTNPSTIASIIPSTTLTTTPSA